jgi:hypothetical protein
MGLALSSTLDDDELYGYVHLIKVHLEGYVRAARSAGMDSATRDTDRSAHLQEVQRHVVSAEERLFEWRSFLGWMKLSLGVGRRPVRRRPHVNG